MRFLGFYHLRASGLVYMRVLLFTAGEIGSAVTLYGLGGFFSRGCIPVKRL